MGHTCICKKDRWTSRGMSHGPMGSCGGMDCGTHTHLREVQVDIPWNVPWSHGIVRWDGQWDTRASVRGTGGHPMEHASVRGTGGHPMECPIVPWDHGMGWTVGHTCICNKDMWTSCGMSYGPMGSWDGQWDTQAPARETVGCPVECTMVPWDHGMGWFVGHTHI